LVVTGSDTRLVIDSALTVSLPSHDGFLLSHHHEDHVAGVAASRRPASIHPDDLPAVTNWESFASACGYDDPRWPALVLEDFEWRALDLVTALVPEVSIDLGGVSIRPVHLPGHTAGHCGFIIEPDGVFYLADIDLTGFGPYYGDECSDLASVRRSLEAVASIPAAVRATFHHKGPYVSDEDFALALRAHRDALDRRHEAVALELARNPEVAADALVDRAIVYRRGTAPVWGPEAERRMIQRHLDELRSSDTIHAAVDKE
jgi:glyoxylase-like metal-dependent hydrolase (beta-lactamase superfamily II)